MDARDVLVVQPAGDGTSVDLVEETSNKRLDEWFAKHGNHRIVVATGFIAKNKEVRLGVAHICIHDKYAYVYMCAHMAG